ncbi:titin homolog isoform X1 [Zeugodacus cucurbitae]|uniref:titin homolog isoform X1 n=1 Tax=Zeugodacus cucurbitae TaxID=28588 RepID=UPI0023D93F62|nr:titin homolog isoform X1 [Zeugodacus cucurbitae]
MENPSSTFEYLCRVCAANTKGKNSVAECVYILKTPALKDKIERYLYLTIAEEDILPKVLCKACFRQVEATASLSKIAKHTQKVFRDFIFNTKSCLQAESSESSTPTARAPASKSPKECASTAHVPERPKPKEREKSVVQNAESTPPATLPASSTCAHKDEVVVNVSVNDPLTRETQHKMITASRRQNSLDARFTPKSIAQRGFASTPKQTEGAAGTKKPTTSGVINFFPNRQQQVTTVTSGGYVIGCAPESIPSNKAAAEQSISNANILQQKRKNLKNALNNIKAVNAGQVSLLKVSQKLGQTTQSSQPQPKAIEPPTLLVEDDVPAEPLPEKMIIAATKQQKHQVQAAPQLTPHIEPISEMQSEPTDLSQSARPSIPDDILLGKVIKDGDLLKLILKALKWPVNKHTMETQLERLRNSRFATIMADPNLLQDADLTQIMGPYLGPVLQAAQMLQQQQVAASAAAAAAATKETELQVAGITTALPYKLPAETSVQLVPASPEEEAEVTDVTPKTSASSQSLKRDAEIANMKLAPPKKVRKVSARGRSASIFNSDEYAALNSTLTSQYLSSKSSPDIHVDLDPAALFTHLGMLRGLSATSSNDALLALLQRQRAALTRLQHPQSQPQPRRQRSNSIITVPASGSDFVFDTDDIILMEPDDCTESTTTNSLNNGDGNTASSSNVSQTESVTFPVPQQVSKPMITRPIIKRRKTVIQASPARMNLAINTKDITPVSSTPSESVSSTGTTIKLVAASSNISLQTAAPPKRPTKAQSLDSLNTIATQFPSNVITIGTQVPSNTTNVTEVVPTAIVTKATETITTATATAATSVSSLPANNASTTNNTTNALAAERTTTRNSNVAKKQTSSKSALGQQLLEAIGLQKVPAENKDVAVVSATAPGPRGSVQQIRSALKKSLQKAQEQQQQRSKKAPSAAGTEDSSEKTVNVVKEVVVQPRAKHASNTSTGPLDVEEEINKITLVLQSKSKDDKKIEEADKRLTAAAPSRIPGIRRKLMPPTRNRKSTVTLVADEIVDLIDDEEHQDAAEGKCVGKNKDKDKDKDILASNAEQEETDVYLTATSLTSVQRLPKADVKDAKSVSPTRKRGRKLKEDIDLAQEEEDDEDDDKPLKPKTEKNAGAKQEAEPRNSTPAPRQRSRPPPANGRKAPSERDFEKESDDTASVKNDTESINSSILSTRPSRVSKTMSKYYKGPDKSPGTTRRTPVSTRSTRVRN